MIKVRILYNKNGKQLMSVGEWQDKSFKDEEAAMEWCRKNAEKIGCINDYRTGYERISHFEIMDALRGKAY